jgi:hypothetical protein
MVLDLLDAGKISVADAEMLIFAMQPQHRSRRIRRELLHPEMISVKVDGAQENLGTVMQKVGRAFELASASEVKQ